ncbi:recombinase family protein [Nocardia rhizosphaerihabitans]|uniref:recombinase family protein n=1 Tax=Nocardia rhizosphaerihabitans TaxID=1691570 RepID=UPI00366D7CC4
MTTAAPPALRSVRAIVGARVSHMQGEQKTSHLTQHSKGDAYALAHTWVVTGYFEDLDVSAIKLSPWERPDLRKWLIDKPDEWDAIIFAKTDRVFRSAKDCVALAEWCKENRKILVLIDDGIKLDYYHQDNELDSFAQGLAEVFLMLAAMFAGIEGRRFVQRAADRVSFLKFTDRWGYGQPPYGFVVVEHKDGKGKMLAHDPVAQKILHRIAAEYLRGDSVTEIVDRLITEKVLSPQDRLRQLANRKTKGDKWSVTTVQKLLTRPSTQGVKLYKGKVVLDEKGSPVLVGPPSFDVDTWAQLQRTQAERAQTPRARRHSENPILGIGDCRHCTKNLRQQVRNRDTGSNTRYYYCSNKPRPCPGVSIRADDADALVEDAFLRVHKTRRVKKKVWREGSDHSAELELTEHTIKALREDRNAGLYPTEEDEKTYREQMLALITRRDALSKLPIVRAGWMMVESEQTYGDVWEKASIAEKRTMMVDAGVRLTIDNTRQVELFVPLDKVLGEGPSARELYDSV